jgi:hypothetical protein
MEWEFIGELSSTNGVLQLVADPVHHRLLLGTTLGYRIFDPLSSDWIIRETTDTTGNYKVSSFLADEEDSLALLTGRENALWEGYIMDNHGLTTLGPITMEGWNLPGGEEDAGGVWGLGKLSGTPDALFASTLSFNCGYVLRSLDGGQVWSSVHDFCAGGGAGGWDLEVAPNGDILVSYGGFDEYENGIIRSSDGGDSWVEVAGDMPCVMAIGEILVDPSSAFHYFARQGRWYNPPADAALGVWATLDGGQHWEQVLQGNVTDLAMHPNDADILVAVERTEGAVLLTRDGGITWENITGNLPPIGGETQCAVCPTDERIYVADYYTDGIWATSLYVTGASHASEAECLLTVHPNPFNPSTLVSFTLRHSAAVSLEVLDVQGRLVRRLVAADLRPAGLQTMRWDGRDDSGQNLPSGLYLARLEAGAESSVIKVLLVR